MAQAYVRNMMSQGLGLPSWDASPAPGISCGDIGVYTQETGFKKIWNLWDMDDVIRDALGIDPTTEEVSLPERITNSEAGMPVWGLGDSLAIGAEVEYTKPYSRYVQVSRMLNLCSTTRIFVTENSECFYKFRTTAEEGSVLAMIATVHRFNLTQESQLALKNFIVHYAEALYQWTLERHGEHLPPGSPIYFVTGYYKTTACAMAGFSSQSACRTLALTGESDARKRKRVGSEQLSYHWRGGEGQGNLETKINYEDTGTQYLFLQGFSLLPYEGWDRPAKSDTSGGLPVALQSMHLGAASSSGNATAAPGFVPWLSSEKGLSEHVKVSA